jgi:hypothetical protein
MNKYMTEYIFLKKFRYSIGNDSSRLTNPAHSYLQHAAYIRSINEIYPFLMSKIPRQIVYKDIWFVYQQTRSQ